MKAIEIEKGPSEDLDYSFSFARFTNLAADPLASVTITSSGGATPSIGSPSISGTTVTVRISGGTAGTTYRLTFTGTTTAGRDVQGWVDMIVDNPPSA